MNRDQIQVLVLDSHQSIFPPPIIIIEPQAFKKIKCFVDLCDYEINGFGSVKCVDNCFTITDVFILKQYVTPAHVDVDPKALNQLIYQLVKKGRDSSNLKFQWHSHASLPSFFSPEDVGTTGNYMNDYMISLVINKAGEYRARIDLFKPFQLSLQLKAFTPNPLFSGKTLRNCYRDIRKNVYSGSQPLKLNFPDPQQKRFVDIGTLLVDQH